MDAQRHRRRLTAAVYESLRDLRSQMSLFNRRIGANFDLKDVDVDCLDLINRHGLLSPGALARNAGLHPATVTGAGLHPATVTGILDPLERAGWVACERRSSDRRAVVVRALRDRNSEVHRLLSGMNTSMDQICAGYPTRADQDRAGRAAGPGPVRARRQRC